MNFDFDRIAMLAGVESEEPKILNESAEMVNESDEKRIREIIREELSDAVTDADEKNAFDKARDTRSLVQASHFINMTRYGRILPAPAPGTAGTERRPGMLGFVGGLGFHN